LFLALSYAVMALVFGTGSLGLKAFAGRFLVAASLPLFFLQIVALLTWWHAVLTRRAAEEREEEGRVQRQFKSSEDIFGDASAVLRLAENARQAFERYFIPGFTLVAGLSLMLLGLLLWGYLGGVMNQPPATVGLEAAGLCLFLCLFCVLSGSYYNGVSREDDCRRLRPLAQWFYLGSAVFFLGLVLYLYEHYARVAVVQTIGSRAVLCLLMLLGAELVFNFIIEFYRPRSVGEEARPLVESRLLALITEPGGLARNVAHALDYQFGFKVSETWFYRFLERAVLPFVAVLVLLLYLLDCFVLVQSHELAMRERFGRPVSQALGPGLYIKWPRPIERLRVVSVSEVRKLNVGFEEQSGPGHAGGPEPDMMQGDPTGKVLVWGKTHFKSEARFLVAAQEQQENASSPGEPTLPTIPGLPSPILPGLTIPATPAGVGSQTVPVNYLTANIPIYYRVNAAQLHDYLYNYRNPHQSLDVLAWREVVRTLASADMVDLIGHGREAARQTIERNLKQTLAELQPPLGLEIVFVGFMGAHPPVEAAEAFQRVVGAHEDRLTRVLRAEQYAFQTTNAALGERRSLVSAAEGYKYSRLTVDVSEADRFRQQLLGYRVAPEVFRTRAYLDTLDEVAKSVRKYVIAAGDAREVLIIDMQEKLRPDLMDVDLDRPSP